MPQYTLTSTWAQIDAGPTQIGDNAAEISVLKTMCILGNTQSPTFDLVGGAVPQQVGSYAMYGSNGAITYDESAGTMTIGVTGLYTVSIYQMIHVVGNTKDFNLEGYINLNGTDVLLAPVNVADNSADDITIYAALSRELNAGDVIDFRIGCQSKSVTVVPVRGSFECGLKMLPVAGMANVGELGS